jgi:hypothetical protein
MAAPHTRTHNSQQPALGTQALGWRALSCSMEPEGPEQMAAGPGGCRPSR